MAKASYTLITAPGTYPVWLDYLTAPPNTSYAVEFAAAATGSYTVQFTLDDPNPGVGEPNVGWTPIWIADALLGTAQTATGSNYTQFPIRGVRVIFSAISGSAMFVVLQGMSAR